MYDSLIIIISIEIHNIDKKYNPGQPSKKLYIKNLARQVGAAELEWVFGRYFASDKEAKE